MTLSEHTTHEFAPHATSAGDARRFVRHTLAEWGAQGAVDDAVLLTNELVTNAVVHAGTTLSVTCALGAGYVQISVADSHSARMLPTVIGNSGSEKTSGRGLYLMSQIAQSWGVDYEGAAKRVWFRLALAPTTPKPVTAGPGRFIDLGTSATPLRVAVVETDPSGLVLDWSTDAELLLGWPSADVVGHPFADLVTALAEDTGTDAVRSFHELLDLPRWSGEYRMRTASGHDLAVFGSHVHATVAEEPRMVMLVVPSEHRAVLMPGTAPEPSEAEPLSPMPTRTGLLPLDTLLELAVEHSRDLLGGDVAYALLVTDDDLDVELRATTGLERTLVPTTRWRKPPDLADRPEAEQPQVHADITAETVTEKFLAETGVHALVTAPMLIGARVIGRIGVGLRRAESFSAEDAARLQHSVGRFSLAIEGARLNELEQVRRGRLSFLAESSDLLAGVLDLDMAAALTAQLVVPRLADWCAVYLVDPRRAGRLSCVWHAQEIRIDPLHRMLRQVRPPPLEESGRPQQWPALGEYIATNAVSDEDARIVGGPTVTVTLLARGRAIGTLIAGHSAGREFVPGTMDTLDDLCRRAAWALDNARLYRDRSRISDALQRSLLPAGLPNVPGLAIGITYEAAGEGIEVGGDFYDVFGIDERRWGFVIGDVCGKGAEAAAVAGLARHSLRVLAREHKDVPAVLRRLNETILAEGEATRFVTMIYGEMVPNREGGVDITFAAAGHPLPRLVGDDGTIQVVGRAQPLLGVFTNPVYESDTLTVPRGHRLVCNTDGVTDRRVGGRTLGDPGLHNLLRQTATLPAPAVAARMRQAVLEFGPEPLQDDFAVLVLEPVGPEA